MARSISRNARSSRCRSADRCIHDSYWSPVKRIPLPAPIPENHNEVTRFCILGRLRGAVPIIFATYPVVAGVEGSNIIFNIVFFITIVSLVVQGTTISFVARILHLSEPLAKTGNDFGVELPEEIDSDLSDMTVTREMLEEADTLKDMNLPKGTLVMIVKRKDEFLIPNGTLKLHEGDKLLLISEKSKEESDSE